MKWKVKALPELTTRRTKAENGKFFDGNLKCYKSHRRNIYTFLASWMFYLYIRLCYVTSTGTVFLMSKKNMFTKNFEFPLSPLKISGPLSKLIQSHRHSRMAICFPSPLSVCRWASCYVTWNLKVGLSSRKGNCVCTQKSCLKKRKTFFSSRAKVVCFSFIFTKQISKNIQRKYTKMKWRECPFSALPIVHQDFNHLNIIYFNRHKHLIYDSLLTLLLL